MTGSKSFIVVSLLSLLSVVLSLDPLDPEEAAFINTRCLEDHVGQKQCLIKCILEKIGLYNPSSGKFEGELIRKQKEKYSDLVSDEDANAYADAVSKLPETKNDCTDVYTAYQPINKEHKLTYLNLFHENLEKAKKIYDELGKEIKQPKQSALHFCENKFYPPDSSDREDVCAIRQFQVIDSDTYKNHMQCVYKLLRYITKDDKFDPSELKRDFKLTGKDTGRLEQVLNECKSSEPSDSLSIAVHYYKCLQRSNVFEDYMEVLHYREVRSMDYRENIGKGRTYDKAAVTKQVEELDAKQCPDG